MHVDWLVTLAGLERWHEQCNTNIAIAVTSNKQGKTMFIVSGTISVMTKLHIMTDGDQMATVHVITVVAEGAVCSHSCMQ